MNLIKALQYVNYGETVRMPDANKVTRPLLLNFDHIMWISISERSHEKVFAVMFCNGTEIYCTELRPHSSELVDAISEAVLNVTAP